MAITKTVTVEKTWKTDSGLDAKIVKTIWDCDAWLCGYVCLPADAFKHHDKTILIGKIYDIEVNEEISFVGDLDRDGKIWAGIAFADPDDMAFDVYDVFKKQIPKSPESVSSDCEKLACKLVELIEVND